MPTVVAPPAVSALVFGDHWTFRMVCASDNRMRAFWRLGCPANGRERWEVSRIRTLKVVTELPAPVERVFGFFADAGNLGEITPPWLHFEILTPRPIEMQVGTLIDYRIRLRGLPVRWRTKITAWEPGRRFVDEQIRGPYSLWRHEHTFEEITNRSGQRVVRMTDAVQYALPLGPLGEIAHALFVRRDLERIFEFRTRKVLSIFGPEGT